MDCPNCGVEIPEREAEDPCAFCGMDKDGKQTWKKYRVEWTEYHSAVVRAEDEDRAYYEIHDSCDSFASFRDLVTGDIREVDESVEETERSE